VAIGNIDVATAESIATTAMTGDMDAPVEDTVSIAGIETGADIKKL
jgi:hypothetical protein